MTKPTITKVPTTTLILVRDGQRVSFPPNKAERFTAAEIAEIEKVDKTALRDPQSEEAPATDDAGHRIQGGSEQEDRQRVTDDDDDKTGDDADPKKVGADNTAGAAKAGTSGTSKTGGGAAKTSKTDTAGL